MNRSDRKGRRLDRDRVVIAVLVAGLVVTGSTLIFEQTKSASSTGTVEDWTCYAVSSEQRCMVGLLPPGVTLPLSQGGVLTVNFTTPASAQGHLNLSVDFSGQYQNLSFTIVRSSEYMAILTSPRSHLSEFESIFNATFSQGDYPWNASGNSVWVFVLFNPSPGSEVVSFPSGIYLLFRS